MILIGERLAEVRKDHGEKQTDLADYLKVSLSTIRSWEQEKSSPSHEALVSICRHYQVSADYLLGLSNVDPSYAQHLISEQFSKSELKELYEYRNYLLWKRLRRKSVSKVKDGQER